MVIYPTIMDTNTFLAEHTDALETEPRKLTDNRRKLLGQFYRLFDRKYEHLFHGKASTC